MDQKSSLLEQLKIDRTGQQPPAGRAKSGRIVLITCAALIVLGGAGGLVYWRTSRADAVPVREVLAQAIASEGAGGAVGASILDASGYVVARRQATVSSYLVDTIKHVLVQEGERVKKGEVLATLDASVLRANLDQSETHVAQARAQLAAARLAAADAKPIYRRDHKELAEGLISPDAFDAEKTTYDAARAEAKVAKENLAAAQAAVVVNERDMSYTIIRAPFDGVVTAKNAQPGQIVSPYIAGGGGIANIVDMNSLEVDVDVSEDYISRVHPGQRASITLDAYPNWHMPAHVIAIVPTANRSKATVKVRVGFQRLDPRILPQMGARVSFLAAAAKSVRSSPAAPSGVIVPSSAVAANGNTGTVYVVENGTVESRKVELGASTPGGQEILSGLQPGATVAIGDFTKLHNGARVRVTHSAL